MSHEPPPSPEPADPESNNPESLSPEPTPSDLPAAVPMDEAVALDPTTLPTDQSADAPAAIATDAVLTDPPTPAATPEPTAVDDEILPQTLWRLLHSAWSDVQPVIKQQSIKTLRAASQRLADLAERLEAEPPPTPVIPPAATPSGRTTRPSAASGRPTQPIASLWDTVQPTWRRLQGRWRNVLRQIRDRLPALRQLSDPALTGAIGGIAAILLWTTTSLFSGSPAPPTVAQSPSPAVELPSPIPAPPVVSAPEPPKPIVVSPSPVVPSPPPPPLKLTPEQKLIARIQNQVTAISNQYANGLIQSVQANFRSSRLTVRVSDGWYGLSRSQQDKLASEVLLRVQDLDFVRLELVDADNTLLARSPVVGSEMVILKREASAAAAT